MEITAQGNRPLSGLGGPRVCVLFVFALLPLWVSLPNTITSGDDQTAGVLVAEPGTSKVSLVPDALQCF